MTEAALGFCAHTGWAMAVTVGGHGRPRVLARLRLELAAGDAHVYHSAAELALSDAEKLLAAAAAAARARADRAVRALRDAHGATSAGIVVGNAPFDAPLEKILAAHPLIHAAEGVLYRQALIEASRAAGLAVAEVPAKQLAAQAAGRLRASDLPTLLVEVGREAGRPWGKDEKDAYLAACVASRRA